MESYYGYPRRNYSFYSPYSDVNPDEYLNPYYRNSIPNGNYYFNPYYNSNSQPNWYRNPYANPNPNLFRTPNPNANPNSNSNPLGTPNANPNPNPHRTQNANPNPTMKPTTNSNPSLKPRVVSIPVRFVNTDHEASQLLTQPRLSAEMAALKLQKVIRGFLVRKNWSIVRKIETEAEAIGEEIARDEAVLEKEMKARIKIGEMLMNLLFRLDSVRGVRDYRKKVIRKVISLQELVDSIGARGNKVESDVSTIEAERSDVAVDSVEFAEQNTDTPQIEENNMVETVDSMEETPINVTSSVDINKCTKEGPSSDLEEYVMVDEAVNPMEESPIDPVKLIEMPRLEKSDQKPDEVFTEAQELDVVCDPTESLEVDDNDTRSNMVDQATEPSPQHKENDEMEMKGVKEVMEKVMIQSESMKSLMEELCWSNARQWQLMEGLVNRVQRLEREVARMERRDKKKRKGRKSESSTKKCEQWNSC